MILPSDDDSRKPGDSDPSGQDPDDALPWEGGADDPPGFFGDDEDEEPGDPSGKVQSPAPPGWRDELKDALVEAVDDLKEIEDPAEDFDPPEPPDLFTFYGELVAVRHELRRGARRSTEALQQLTAGSKSTTSQSAQPAVMAMVYLWDRVNGGETKLLPLLDSAMRQAGIQRVATRDASFDPATMVTDAPVSAGAKVTRELEAGFLWNGLLLRPARVELT